MCINGLRAALWLLLCSPAVAWHAAAPARAGAGARRASTARAGAGAGARRAATTAAMGTLAGEPMVGELRAATLPSPTCAMPSRAELLERMEREEFDILVIGGGATGAGVAHDAATRGLKVALVERGDFGSGTSSRSTKLIHGGLRYLAQAFQSKIPPNTLLDVVRHLRFEPDYLRIVQADLAERAWMIDSAPFMAHPIPMMVPLYKWWEVPMFFVTGKL
jgi:hypothetical protein